MPNEQQELIKFLKNDDIECRISSADKWLVWYLGEWVVFYQPYRARKARCLYSGSSLHEALKALKGER